MSNTFRFAWVGLLFTAASLHAAGTAVIPLWTNGAPGFENRRHEPEVDDGHNVHNIHNPSLTVFLPPKEKANGAAVLICPGGGHRTLVYVGEGYEPAEYFNKLGVAAFVLKYRLANESNSPYSTNIHPRQDSQRAMRIIRSRAAEWNLDPKRIGVIGFSAGGGVAQVVTFSPPQGDPHAADAIDRAEAKVDFLIDVYPGPLGTPDKLAADAPPAFFVVAADDVSHARPIFVLADKYRDAGRPYELHVYQHGGHGFKMGTNSKFAEIKSWPGHLTDWLVDNKIVPAPATP